MQSYTTLYFESGWNLLAMQFGLDCTLVQCITHSILLLCSLHYAQASQTGLATPKLPQPRVTLQTLLPVRPSVAAASAQPYRKPESLRLLNI